MRTLAWYWLALGALGGCLPQHSSSQQLLDAARELNDATRFGRMELATGLTADAAQDGFLERHQNWGADLRVLDVQVLRCKILGEEQAEVLVEVAWTHMAESSLRNTTLKQSWENRERGGWKLVRERRVAGASGLFGERASRPHARPRQDVHFPSKTLGSTNSSSQALSTEASSRATSH